MPFCKVPGCTKSCSTRFGAMCTRHQQRNRRHGDPCQDTIRYTEIKPYVQRVERLVQGKDKILEGLTKVCGIIRDYAEGIVTQRKNGMAMNKYKAPAAKEILTVIRDFTPVQCGSVVAGMFIFEEENRYRFASRRGFTFELVRRFRSISDANIGIYGACGNVRRAYKEIPPQTIQRIGDMLIEGFRGFVGGVLLYERRQAERERQAKALLNEGFAEVLAEEEESHG